MENVSSAALPALGTSLCLLQEESWLLGDHLSVEDLLRAADPERLQQRWNEVESLCCRSPRRTNPQQSRDSSPRPASLGGCGAVRGCFRHQLTRSLLLLPGAQRSIRHGHAAVPRPPVTPLVLWEHLLYLIQLFRNIFFIIAISSHGRRHWGQQKWVGCSPRWQIRAAQRGSRTAPSGPGPAEGTRRRDPQKGSWPPTRSLPCNSQLPSACQGYMGAKLCGWQQGQSGEIERATL